MKTSLGTKLYTWLFGTLVGKDQFTNMYYRQKQSKLGQREKRWVIYNEEPEGSAVPPEWQGWLTHTLSEPPTEKQLTKQSWMIDHRPNPTGTRNAYRPPGALEKGGIRPPAIGDYEPWRPD
ncbi:uncharacterized protein METZ01_LOCUS309955 [marine metagenome]|uniref:NADH:ubiquinone oxidoreductase subunit NDUFA12 n=1 Tax=marine metagenome TaxID=408172 RepID=A0A382NC05_9ZZZZ